MALQNTDYFVVNRGGVSYRVPFSAVDANAQQALTDAADALAAAQAAEATANSAATAAAAALPMSGGNMTGAITSTEVEITASAFDLTQGNFYRCGAITVPNPSGGVNGQSGLIRITEGPVVWGPNFKFPAGIAPTITAFPAVIPFYVEDASTILMGQTTQGIL